MFRAGIANFFSWQYLKSFCTSSPLQAVSIPSHLSTEEGYLHDDASLSGKNVGGAHCEIGDDVS